MHARILSGLAALAVAVGLTTTGAGAASATGDPDWLPGTGFPAGTAVWNIHHCVELVVGVRGDQDGIFLIGSNGNTIWKKTTGVYYGHPAIVTFNTAGDFTLQGWEASRASAGGYALMWHSSTDGEHAGDLKLQADGNLVIYDVTGKPLWASNTFHTC